MGKSLKRMQRRKPREKGEEDFQARIRPGEVCNSCDKRKHTRKQKDGTYLCSLCEKDAKAIQTFLKEKEQEDEIENLPKIPCQ
jgi:ribosomal protein L37AE/L43A